MICLLNIGRSERDIAAKAQMLPGRFVVPVLNVPGAIKDSSLTVLGNPFLVKKVTRVRATPDRRTGIIMIVEVLCVEETFLKLLHGKYAVIASDVRGMMDASAQVVSRVLSCNAGMSDTLYMVCDTAQEVAALKNRELERNRRYKNLEKNLERSMGCVMGHIPCVDIFLPEVDTV